MGLRSFVLGSALVQGLTNVREALPTELFPGVEKPTVTLAKMLCAEMLQNLDVQPKTDYDRHYTYRVETYRFPSFALELNRDLFSSVKMKDGSTPIQKEGPIIMEAFAVFNKLRLAKAAADAEAKRQDSALSVIETYLKPKEVPCVELKPVEKSSKTPAGPPPSALDALLSPVAS